MTLRCPICGRKLRSLGALRRHGWREHGALLLADELDVEAWEWLSQMRERGAAFAPWMFPGDYQRCYKLVAQLHLKGYLDVAFRVGRHAFYTWVKTPRIARVSGENEKE